MPSFNYQNAYICRKATLPAPFSGVTTIAASDLQVLGICKADSGYTCKATQKEMSSSNVEYSLSNTLEINIQVLSKIAPSSAFADLDNGLNCIVLVNSENLPELVPENEAGSYKTLAELLGDIPLPAGVTCTVLRPITTHIDEDVKVGGGKVAPFVISGTREIVGDKNACRLLNIPVGSPTVKISGVILAAQTGDPVDGVLLAYNDGGAKTVISDGNGEYEIEVTYDFSGTVTPTHSGFTFIPSERTYVDLEANAANEGFIAVIAN
jgi:hypothetical protein